MGGVVPCATFSLDGTVLVTSGETGSVRAMRLEDREVLWTTAVDCGASRLVYSPDGTQIACGARDLTVHDASTGRERLRIEGCGFFGFAWLPEGDGFVYATGGTVVVRRPDGATTVRASFADPVFAIAVDSAGTLFAGDGSGRVWRLPRVDAGSEAARPVLVHDHRVDENDRVRMVELAHDGRELIQVPSTGTLRRGHESHDLPGPTYRVAMAAAAPAFVVGGSQPLVRWWYGDETRDIVADGAIAALALSPDGQRLVLATYEGRLELLDADGTRTALPPVPARVQALALSPDGAVIAFRGVEWAMHPVRGGAITRMPDAVAIVPGRRGSELVVVEPKRVVLVEPHQRRELAVLEHEAFPMSPVAAGPGDTLLVNGSFVDVATQRAIGSCEHLRFAHDFAAVRAPTGAWCAGTWWGIEGDFGHLLLTDERGKKLGETDDGPVYAVAFSPDGSKLYYGCGTGISIGMGPPGRNLRVRDARTFELLHDVEATVYDWWFLDAHHALAAGTVGLELWHAERLERLHVHSFDEPYPMLQFSPESRTLARAVGPDIEIYRVHFEP